MFTGDISRQACMQIGSYSVPIPSRSALRMLLDLVVYYKACRLRFCSSVAACLEEHWRAGGACLRPNIYIDNCKWLCYPNVGRIWCKDHVRFIGRCSSSRIDYMVKEREEYNTKPTPHAWLVVHIYQSWRNFSVGHPPSSGHSYKKESMINFAMTKRNRKSRPLATAVRSTECGSTSRRYNQYLINFLPMVVNCQLQ